MHVCMCVYICKTDECDCLCFSHSYLSVYLSIYLSVFVYIYIYIHIYIYIYSFVFDWYANGCFSINAMYIDS